MSRPSIKVIRRDSTAYPANIELFLGELSPASVSMIGNEDILSNRKLGLFCSSKCPGSVILRTYDLAQKLRAEGHTVIGGFHSPMEKECLSILLRSPHPVIICPARGLERMNIPIDWRKPLSDGRLLLLSPFSSKVRRATAAQARQRNEFVAALAEKILIAHAARGSKLNRLAAKVISWGKPALALADEGNKELIKLGFKPWK